MLRRWLVNIKWLFNHLPTGITNLTDVRVKCEYCGSASNLVNFPSQGFAVCRACIKVACDDATAYHRFFSIPLRNTSEGRLSQEFPSKP